LQKICDSHWESMLLNGLADAWLVTSFIKYSWSEEMQPPAIVGIVCSRFAAMRCVMHAISLKQGFKRIIDLDVDEYKSKIVNGK
jgi:hypothetical protein